MVWVIFTVHLAATFMMIGAVWFMKIVHFPLYGYIERDRFTFFERLNLRFTFYLIFPTMVVEAVTGIFLVWVFHWTAQMPWTILNIVLLVVIWIVTFGICIPKQRILMDGYDETAHSKLMNAHTLRSTLWAIRGALLIVMCIHMCPGPVN